MNKKKQNKLEILYPAFESIFMSHDEKRLLKVLYYLLVAASASALFLLLLNFTFGSITEEAGQFGDFFGGMLNPILTFLTFFGLIATIVIQKQELKSARIEYERTATALSTQAIETTFFNILDLHHKLADNLTIDLSNLRPGYQKIVPHVIEGLTGKAAQTLFNGRSSFEATLDFLTTGPQAPDSAINVYLNIQKNHNHVFGHYFRNLYQALKVIDSYSETLLPDSDKRKYTSILRAQLSTSELAILMINCVDNVCDQGQFRNLLVKYSMLEHLPYEEIDEHALVAGKLTLKKQTLDQFKNIKQIPNPAQKIPQGAFGKNSGSNL